MCKVKNCIENHAKHYCIVCKKDDSSHFSRNCPEGTTIYHGTKRQYAQLIQQNGFKKSGQGRIGQGVYFTLDYNQAKEIACYKFKNDAVVIECRAKVDFKKFSREDNEQQLIQKLDEWYKFCKQTAKQAIHPPWANNKQFRQVCVKDPKAIRIIKIHHV